jgi:hypothetical protein
MFSSPNTIRIVKSRIMRWAGHAVNVEGKRSAYSVFVGYPEGNKQVYLYVNRRIILKLILE